MGNILKNKYQTIVLFVIFLIVFCVQFVLLLQSETMLELFLHLFMLLVYIFLLTSFKTKQEKAETKAVAGSSSKYEILNSFIVLLNSMNDYGDMLKSTLNKLADEYKISVSCFYKFEPEKKAFELKISFGEYDHYVEEILIAENYTSLFQSKNKNSAVYKLKGSDFLEKVRGKIEIYNYSKLESLYIIPLYIKGGYIGSFVFASPTKLDLSYQVEAAVLEEIICQMGRAVERSLQTKSNQFHNRKNNLLYRISKVLEKKLDEKTILNAILDEISNVLENDYATLFLVNKNQELEPRIIRGKIIDLKEKDSDKISFLDDLVVRKKSVILNSKILSEITPKSDIKSILSCPLLIGSKLIGILNIASRSEDKYVKDDEFLMEIISTQIALTLQKFRYYQRIEELAIIDGLTGFYNHRQFKFFLNEEEKRANRYNTPTSLIFLDIDDFKKVNDTYGHAAGDKILKVVAGLIHKNSREVDYCCRYGGEEFAVILPNTLSRAAFDLAERIRKAIASTAVKLGDVTVNVTISSGVSCMKEIVKTKEALIESADKALYKSKSEGKNCVNLGVG